MSRRRLWALVTSHKDGRGPISVDGPYLSRREAEDVRFMYAQDEPDEVYPHLVGKLRYTVAPIDRVMSHIGLFGHTRKECDESYDHAEAAAKVAEALG